MIKHAKRTAEDMNLTGASCPGWFSLYLRIFFSTFSQTIAQTIVVITVTTAKTLNP
jgi:hypothetical protein